VRAGGEGIGTRPSAARLLLVGLVVLLAAGGAAPALAQQADLNKQILESQRRLEEIRAERTRLQQQMDSVQAHVRDASAELVNVERQLSASRSVLAEVTFQVDATSKQVEETTKQLIETRERREVARATLARRLRDIYEMGPLHTVRVLLGATSFTDLLNRYRYLQRVAAYDKALVDHVADIEQTLTQQNDNLQQRMARLGTLRQTRLSELAQLKSMEAERQADLSQLHTQTSKTKSRLDQLDSDEKNVTNLIADLERQRMEAARRAASSSGPPGSALSSADEGTLSWPVDGKIIYRFGKDRRPNGVVLRWNGIGIAAPPGTPVRAVRGGRVVLAGPFEGYGPTVVISHGDGFYTLYLYLEDIGVVEGREVQTGQVVGTVGGTDTPEGPHVEFQIRAPVNGGAPQAQDPLKWLKSRGSGG
jgi:septal ring factor EnvC (AmiA/AmiB activator)